MTAWQISPIGPESAADLGRLLAGDRSSAACWCMWFIIPVRDFHAGGAEANRGHFMKLAAAGSPSPGLLAYAGGEPVGWCAVGPRMRYVRAIRTPTYKGRDPEEDATVWLLPCMFVRRDLRGSSLSEILVREAVLLARAWGATAIESFPLASGKRHRTDTQVGFESVFARCGFGVLRRPSESRVVMRRDL